METSKILFPCKDFSHAVGFMYFACLPYVNTLNILCEQNCEKKLEEKRKNQSVEISVS